MSFCAAFLCCSAASNFQKIRTRRCQQSRGQVLPHGGTVGDGLGVVVSLAVGLILFEGGLTLDRKGYSSAPAVIRRLLTLGVVEPR